MKHAQDIRIGIIGLGGAAQLVLPYFEHVPGVDLAGAADTREAAREEFTNLYDRPAYSSIEALCASDIDAVWIETPNHLHGAHGLAAAEAGKHVICAKPLGATVEECGRLIEAARRTGVRLLLGHSKVMDSPIRAMRRVIDDGRLGRVIQVNSMLFNDWLQRPRLEEELDVSKGGGLIFRQVPHLVDIVNYLVGRPARNVRALTGRWDPHFEAEGNALALIEYKGGAAACLSVNGYGYFDSRDLTWGIGGTGDQAEAPTSGRPARRRRGPVTESEKYETGHAGEVPARRKQGTKMPIFGLTIVSCERGVIRQSPNGIFVYSEDGTEEIAAEPYLGRAAELIELRDALAADREVFPDGAWGRATVELCEAIVRSAIGGCVVPLRHQVNLKEPAACYP